MRAVGPFLLGWFVALIRLFDLSTKIWYLSTQDFRQKAAFYAFIACLITPTIALIAIFFLIKNKYLWKSLKFSLVFIVLDSIAVSFLLFPVFSAFWKGKQEKFKLLKDLLRLSPVVVNAFQSSPMLIIMIFNEIFNKNWNISIVLAVSATAGSFIATILMILVPRNENTKNSENKVEDLNVKEHEVIKNTESSTFKISNQSGQENSEKGEDLKIFEIR